MRIIYGINPVSEALKSSDELEKILVSGTRTGRAVDELIKAAGARKVAVERAPQERLDTLAGAPAVHQGVIAMLRSEFKYREFEELIDAWKKSDEPAFFLILDSVQDPQNLGSLIRTATAAGVHGIIIPKDRACEVTPVVVKASAGATEHALIARETNLVRTISALKELNVWVAGIEASAGEDIYMSDLKGDLAIVVGSEGKGIRRLVKEACDFCVSIPMSGKLNSLNAAQAGAIALFEARRQRKS